MPSYNKLSVDRLILPTLYEEIVLGSGIAFATTLGFLYLLGTREAVIVGAVQSFALDPLTSFLDKHQLTELSNNIITFSLYIVIGILCYLIVYLIMNNLVLVSNEVMLDKFHHPTSHWHHWGRFFSVEAIKVVLGALIIMGMLLLLLPFCAKIYGNLSVITAAGARGHITPLLVNLVLTFLILNGLLILTKLYRHLSV